MLSISCAGILEPVIEQASDQIGILQLALLAQCKYCNVQVHDVYQESVKMSESRWQMLSTEHCWKSWLRGRSLFHYCSLAVAAGHVRCILSARGHDTAVQSSSRQRRFCCAPKLCDLSMFRFEINKRKRTVGLLLTNLARWRINAGDQ